MREIPYESLNIIHIIRLLPTEYGIRSRWVSDVAVRPAVVCIMYAREQIVLLHSHEVAFLSQTPLESTEVPK